MKLLLSFGTSERRSMSFVSDSFQYSHAKHAGFEETGYFHEENFLTPSALEHLRESFDSICASLPGDVHPYVAVFLPPLTSSDLE